MASKQASTADPLPGREDQPLGFGYIPDLLAADEAREVLARLDTLSFGEVRMRGVAVRPARIPRTSARALPPQSFLGEVSEGAPVGLLR